MSEEQNDSQPVAEDFQQDEEVESGEVRTYFNTTDQPYRMDNKGHELAGGEQGEFPYNKRIQYALDQGWLVDKEHVAQVFAAQQEVEDAKKSVEGKQEELKVEDPGPRTLVVDSNDGPAPKAQDGVQRNRKRAGAKASGSDESQEK